MNRYLAIIDLKTLALGIVCVVVTYVCFVMNASDGMKNTGSLKRHGTLISLWAYCLLFVFVFPFVFAPTMV